jgi:hypothetical protein
MRNEKLGREGLSSDCTLNPMIVLAIMMAGREHPCDRCNADRKVCRGFPRLDASTTEKGATIP